MIKQELGQSSLPHGISIFPWSLSITQVAFVQLCLGGQLENFSSHLCVALSTLWVLEILSVEALYGNKERYRGRLQKTQALRNSAELKRVFLEHYGVLAVLAQPATPKANDLGLQHFSPY